MVVVVVAVAMVVNLLVMTVLRTLWGNSKSCMSVYICECVVVCMCDVLNWLPADQWLANRIAALVGRCLLGLALPYLHELP